MGASATHVQPGERGAFEREMQRAGRTEERQRERRPVHRVSRQHPAREERHQPVAHDEEEGKQEEPQARGGGRGDPRRLLERDGREEEAGRARAHDEQRHDGDRLDVPRAAGAHETRERPRACDPSCEVDETAGHDEGARRDEPRIEEDDPRDHGQGAREPPVAARGARQSSSAWRSSRSRTRTRGRPEEHQVAVAPGRRRHPGGRGPEAQAAAPDLPGHEDEREDELEGARQEKHAMGGGPDGPRRLGTHRGPDGPWKWE